MHVSTLVSVFAISSIFSDVSATYLPKTEDIDKDDLIIYEKYIEMDKSIKNVVNKGIKTMFPYLMEANEHLNISSICGRNLFTLISEVKKLKLSALKFLDSSGKPQPGFFYFTVNMLGNYDECLNAKILSKNGDVMFRGQYCMIDIVAFLPKRKRKITVQSGLEEIQEYAKNTSEFMHFLLSKLQITYTNALKYGACIPSGCTTEDINKIVKYMGEKVFVNATLQYCDVQHGFQYSTGVLVAIIFMSTMCLIAVIGSSVDYYSRKKGIQFEKNLPRYLTCFSVLTNFPKLINTKTQDDRALTSVFGIRTLSLFWVLLLHQFYNWGIFQLNGNGQLFLEKVADFFMQVIHGSGILTIDVFMFLGGLLNAYIRTNLHLDGKIKASSLKIIIHRLWRMYPTYIFSMLAFFLFGNAYGPMGTFYRRDFTKLCETNWWQNLLFINNFFEQEKTCMQHTWYVAADMQLFLISLFTMPVLFRNAKKGIILHLGILITGLIATVLWAWYKDLLPFILANHLEKEDLKRVWNAYATILPHIAPYFTGLIVGFVLSKWKEFKIPNIYLCIGWAAATTCFISMLFVTQNWNAGVEFTLLESSLYFAFSRIVYVLAVAWLVICCSRGYGGILNYILSLKIWIPFSRISYMVYMISLPLQMHYYATLKMLVDVDMMTMIWRHIGDLGVSCLLSLVMVVIIESPFISMEKLIFSKQLPNKENSGSNVENLEKHINNIEMIKETDLVKNEKSEI